jgi:malonyl-CoA/methylmalonyl-CoA synthetase
MEWIRRAEEFRDRIAVVDDQGAVTYGSLLDASALLAAGLLRERDDLREERVALLLPPGRDFVASLWAVWRAGGIAVPLCLSHPAPELEHVLDDAEVGQILASGPWSAKVRPLAKARSLPLSTPGGLIRGQQVRELPTVAEDRRATILYTSGTTGKPKGVVATHANLRAQMESLVEAWGWKPSDHILNVLPLHHVHGLVNILCCALYSGATWETLQRFDAGEVWQRFGTRPLTLFMAVPTIYHRLIHYWHEQHPAIQRDLTAAAGLLRLMVSGSAALPLQLLFKWRDLTGHLLLERYGMTEIGMALSNPLHGVREPGKVGEPLPGVEVRVVDGDLRDLAEEEAGELLVRGPGVFHEYWRQPEATAAAFVDGWFRTGDRVVCEGGAYRILGRESVDILKTGGFKISALEIEAVLRDHPSIVDCAVVGLPDAEWGQLVAVAVVLAPKRILPLTELQAWAKDRLAPYKLPRRLLSLTGLPRNALGKVQKPRVVELFGDPEGS